MRRPPPFRNLSEGKMAAIDKEIVDLLKKGAIGVCLHTPGEFISNIFMIPKKSSRNRAVIDMRVLNEFVEYIPFRMEDISLLKSVLKQGDFMTKLDLRDAYLTVPVDKKSRIYLCFIWRGILYQFTCLFFGLSSSGRIFTKAMRPVIVFLRAMGIRLLIFLDHILIMTSSHKLAMQHTDLVIQVLTSLGFVINFPKSILIPSKMLPYLGFEVNSDLMKLFLPREKLLNLKQFALEIMFQVPTASCVAGFLGFCLLTMPVILETPLHIRAIHRDLIKAIAPLGLHASYKIRVTLSQEAINDLQWWIDSAHLNSGRDIIPPLIDTMIFCDASTIGWGDHLNSILIRGRWLRKEASFHINFLELKAAFLAFQALVP